MADCKMGSMTVTTSPKVGVPTVEDAERAGAALPGSVFLFGSVARGAARKGSDLDFMVVTDRVEGDYGSDKRKTLGIDLAREAREACGFRVQVFLVDWVEWKSRSVVWGTFEHEAASYGLWVRQVEPGPQVQRDLLMSPKQARISAVEVALDNVHRALSQACLSMYPGSLELREIESGREGKYWNQVGVRLNGINFQIHLCLEELLKAMLYLSAVSVERKKHDLLVLFEQLPTNIQNDILEYVTEHQLEWAQQWRETSHYRIPLHPDVTSLMSVVTADVTAYTASLASVFIGPMVSYTALAIQVSVAVANTVRNMPRDPDVSTDRLENLVDSLLEEAEWVRDALATSTWLYPDGTPPHGWRPPDGWQPEFSPATDLD